MSPLAIAILVIVLLIAFGGWGLAGSPLWLLVLLLLVLAFLV